MGEQLSLLPLMHQFNKKGFITDTTYFENEEYRAGNSHLVFKINTYTFLIPEGKGDWLVKTVDAESVVITKGSYNGVRGCFELMFQDDTNTLFSTIISAEHISCESPPKEGWNGELYIIVDVLGNICQKYEKVYYRVADTLPFCKPVEKLKI